MTRIKNQPSSLDGSARPVDVAGPITVTSALMEANVAALNWVDLPAGRINLRIGQSFEPPRGIGGHTRLAVVTACNPFSEVLGDVENNARHASLIVTWPFGTPPEITGGVSGGGHVNTHEKSVGDPRDICVLVDQIDYCPIVLEEVVRRLDAAN